MISNLELQRIIESAFLPQQCRCEITPNGTMNIHLMSTKSNQVETSVTGILVSDLSSSRAIAKLVAEVKEESKLRSILGRGTGT